MSKTIEKLVKLVKDELRSLKNLKSKSALASFVGLALFSSPSAAATPKNTATLVAVSNARSMARAPVWLRDILKSDAESRSGQEEISTKKLNPDWLRCLSDRGSRYFDHRKCSVRTF